MNTKRIWKKCVSYVLASIMLVSIFSTVDMGWNVMEAQAAGNTYSFGTESGMRWSSGCATSKSNAEANSSSGDTIRLNNSSRSIINVTLTGGDSSWNAKSGTYNTSADFIIPSGYKVKAINYSGDFDSGFYFSCELMAVHIHNLDTLAGTNATQHRYKCSANDGSVGSWENHTWLNGKCSVCNYTCTHTGGTATCTTKAVCSTCGESYGDLQGHDFSYSSENNEIIAKCSRSGCAYNAAGITLTLSASDIVYTGSPYTGASLGGTTAWTGASLTLPTINYVGRGATTYDVSETAPTNVGTYTAKITVGEKTATKDFSITKIDPVIGDFTYTAPSSLAYDGNGKTATVVAKDDKTNGTITVKYYNSSDVEVTTPTEVGGYKVKITVTEGDYYNAVTTPMQVGMFTIGQGSYPGTKTASGNLVAKNGKTVEVTLPTIPAGASYGTITNTNTEYFTVGTVSNGKVTVSSAKDWATTETGKTFKIAVTGATNYSNYDVIVTITPVFHSHTFSYTATGNKIKATCGNEDGVCYLPSDANLELVLSASDTTYDAEAAYTGASVDDSKWSESGLASVPSIVYKKVSTEGATTGGEEVSASELRKTAGNYYASITVNGKTAVKAFVVNKLEGPEAPTGLNPIPPKHIDGEDGKIEGVDDSMEYSTDGGETWTPVEEGKTEITGLKKGSVKVRKKGTNTKKPGASTTVTIVDGTDKKPAPPAPEDLTPVAPQTEGGSDGKITGVDDTMEYSTDGGETWTPVETGKTEITGLSAGPVKVRVKETNTTNSGNSVSITIPEGTPQRGSINDVVESVELSGTPEVGETLTVTVTFKEGKDGTLEYQWYRDSDEIEGETENTYVLVEEDKDKIVKVRVTVDGYDSHIDKSTSTSVHGKFIPHIENPAVPTEVSREELKAAISKEALSEEAKQKLEAGKDIIVELVVKDNDHIEEASKAAITSALEEAKSDKEDVKVEKYLDISLFWYFEDESDEKNQIAEAEQEITISLKVPDADPDKEYAVVRNHNGDVTIMGDYDSETETITIKSHLFSDYAICSWKADGKKAKVEKKSDKKKEKKEPDIDYDTFKSELPSRSVLAINPDDTSKIIDMKVHALDKKIASNQELLAEAYASQLGKKAKIVLSYGVYARSYVPMNEDGAKKTLVWNNLSLKTPGEIYAICYNQKDGAYYLAGTVDAKGTAVFNNFLYRDASNITLFVLE